MNGRSPSPDSHEMTALLTYYQWISKGIPIYSKPEWLGLKHLPNTTMSSIQTGNDVYVRICAQCHGNEGQGTKIAPPLWGDQTFNDGAGMSKFDNFAAFTHAFMPKDAADLTISQAKDVAAFVLSKPRPHFKGE